MFDISIQKDNPEQLLALKSEIQDFIEEHKGYIYAGRAAMALVKVLAFLKEPQKALFNFQKISFSYDIDELLYEKEFEGFDYLMDRYQSYLKQKQQEKDFKTKTKTHSLIIPETEKVDVKKPTYEDCFYVIQEIEDHGSNWVHPIHEKLFIAENDNNELYLGEITESYEIIKRDVIALDSDKRYHYAYDQDTLYISIKDEGITRYKVRDNTFRQLEGFIKNSEKIPKYGNLTIHDHYLYICNNEYLEIFDLANPKNNPLSSDLFIDSGYHLYGKDDVLVIGAGAGLVILVDIKDKAKPKYLSTIIEDQTPGNMYVTFVDHYLISRSVIDISDPANPKFVCHTQDKLAPCFSFDDSLPKEVYATEGDLTLKKLEFSSSEPKVTAWIPFYDKHKEYEQRFTGNKATIFSEKTIIGFTSYEIYILQRDKNPKSKRQTYDIQQALATMAQENFEYLINSKPDFQISKIIFRTEPGYGSITFSLQGSSSTAILLDPHVESHVPQVYSDFNFYLYFSNEFEINYDPETMSVTYDINPIIANIISDPRFVTMASKHVSIISSNKSRYLHFPKNDWAPFREENVSKDEQSIIGILTSENDNLLKKLTNEMNDNAEVFEESVEILNTDPNPTSKENTDDHVGALKPELPSYIQGPNSIQIQQQAAPDLKIAKREALKVICSYRDRNVVKNIILNGAKYGIPKPEILEVPENPKPKQAYIKLLVKNWYELWDEFSEDTEVKEFLVAQLESSEDEVLVARLAYQYGLYSHNSIHELLGKLLKEEHTELNYYGYTGQNTQSSINFASFPAETLRPFEKELFSYL